MTFPQQRYSENVIKFFDCSWPLTEPSQTTVILRLILWVSRAIKFSTVTVLLLINSARVLRSEKFVEVHFLPPSPFPSLAFPYHILIL